MYEHVEWDQGAAWIWTDMALSNLIRTRFLVPETVLAIVKPSEVSVNVYNSNSEHLC